MHVRIPRINNLITVPQIIKDARLWIQIWKSLFPGPLRVLCTGYRLGGPHSGDLRLFSLHPRISSDPIPIYIEPHKIFVRLLFISGLCTSLFYYFDTKHLLDPHPLYLAHTQCIPPPDPPLVCQAPYNIGNGNGNIV